MGVNFTSLDEKIRIEIGATVQVSVKDGSLDGVVEEILGHTAAFSLFVNGNSSDDEDSIENKLPPGSYLIIRIEEE